MKPPEGDGAEQREIGKITPGGKKSRNRAQEAGNSQWGSLGGTGRRRARNMGYREGMEKETPKLGGTPGRALC